jgi:hypothetical protein
MRWEYRIEPFVADDLGLMQESLNSLGRDGWDVVAVIASGSGKDHAWPIVVCKRALPEAAKPN